VLRSLAYKHLDDFYCAVVKWYCSCLPSTVFYFHPECPIGCTSVEYD
jgi:hypothetical protein